MDYYSMMGMLNQMQMKQPYVKKYMEARKIHQELYDKMDISFDEDDYTMFTNIVKASNCGNIDFDFYDPQHAKIYGEFLIYPQISGIQSKIEYLQEHTRIRKTEKLRMIKAMIDSTHGMYEVVFRDDMKAITCVENVFTHEQIELVDRGLGAFGQLDEAYLYLHIIHYGRICFQTGLIILLNKNKETEKWLKQNKDIFMKPYDASQFLFVDKYSRSHQFKL